MNDVLRESDQMVERGIKHTLLISCSVKRHMTDEGDSLHAFNIATGKLKMITLQHAQHGVINDGGMFGFVIDGRDARRLISVARLSGLVLNVWHKDAISHKDPDKEKADRARRRADLFHTRSPSLCPDAVPSSATERVKEGK